VTGYVLAAVIFGVIWFLAAKGLKSGPAERPDDGDIRGRTVFWPVGRDGYRVLAAVVAIPFLVWGWFGMRGVVTHRQETPVWSVLPVHLPAGWSCGQMDLPSGVQQVLACSQWEVFRVSPPGKPAFRIYHFFWKPGIEVPSLAVGHSPDICMPSAGWKETAGPLPVTFQLKSGSFPGVIFRFVQDDVEVSVFHSIWHGGQARPFYDLSTAVYGKWDRLLMVWEGQRNRGHEVFTVVMPSPQSPGAETRLFEEFLNQMLARRQE
jgi:hypothetical protein